MRKTVSWSVFTFVIFGCFLQCLGQQLNLWPLPQSVSSGNTRASLSPSSFQFQCTSGSSCSILKDAFQRYQKVIFFADQSKEIPSKAATLTSIQVTAQSLPDLQYGIDESYTLSVNQSIAVLNANTEWGALRGLETFSQLVDWDFSSGEYFIAVLPVHIEDAPRFSWRGLLIDTARHYLPVSTILRTIDALSYNKMNVLHWHVVDDQSFPIQSKIYPLLSKKGSWIPQAVYTQEDVKKVVQYAYLRGVRVVPEFDTPGHASVWGRGYPNLFPNCPGYSQVFDPTNNYTVPFMQNFIGEMGQLFPDGFFHLGGDEVDFSCWQNDPKIQQWMTAHGVHSYADLQAYYETQLQDIVLNTNKVPVYWDEVFGDNQFPLKPEAVFHVWNQPQSEVVTVVKAGYKALYSSAWYLDQQIPNSDQEYYLWEDTWKDFYSADPVGNANLSPDELARILGGEACMWGEQVDRTVFDIRVWPRAAAVGERLWSEQNITDIDQATPRLGTQRCRMVRRGINASPIYPDYCTTAEDALY